MKRFFLVTLFLSMVSGLAAQIDTVRILLDTKDKPTDKKDAPRYALIHQDGTRWKKTVFDAWTKFPVWTAFFSDPDCTVYEGDYTRFSIKGNLIESGRYSANKKTGLWKGFSDEGKLIDSAVYSNDFIQGLSLTWYDTGAVMDSLVFEKDGLGSCRGYYADGVLKQTGPYKNGKKEGKWTYYHYDGGYKCQEVMYRADSALNWTCFDAKGNLQEKDCVYEREAVFKGGDRAWLNYLRSRLSAARFPKAYEKGDIYGVTLVQFVVSSKGDITDVRVEKSSHPDLDKIALSIISNSPRWEPAIQYNRPVKAYRRQPITFARATE